MYSTAPAQEQGARLTAMRHRRLDFSQKLNILYMETKYVGKFTVNPSAGGF